MKFSIFLDEFRVVNNGTDDGRNVRMKKWD